MIVSNPDVAHLPDRQDARPTTDLRAWPSYLTARYLRSPICAIGVACIVLFWGLAIFRSIEVRRQEQADAARDAVNISLVVERAVRDSLNHLDHLLRIIRVRKISMPSVSWSSILNQEYTPGPTAIKLAVIGPDGYRVATTFDAATPETTSSTRSANLSDRDHFKVHVNSKLDEPYISRALIGRGTGQPTIQLTRAYWNPDGSFGAVLVASLDPSQLVKTFKQLDLGAGGGVAVLGKDDVFRAGTGDFEQRVGLSYKEPKSIRLVTVKGLSKSRQLYAVERQTVDGSERLLAAQTVEGLPLTVMVATTNGLNNSNWIDRSNIGYFGSALLGTLAIIFAMLATLRSQRLADDNLEQCHAMAVEKKVAEAAASDRSMFLAVMSHEIRTPLNGVLGALELMRQDQLPERSVRHLQMATESGEALLDLIDDILLFSRLDQSKLKLSEHVFDLATLLQSTAASMQPIIRKGGNTLHIELQAEPDCELKGDGPRLRQVLVNLIGNAAKFTQNGTIHLRALCTRLGNEMTVDLSVTDTGIGIPNDKLNTIFEKFQTLDSSYTRRNDGTGLGLSICDRLVRAMGGHLKVKSDVGRGSCFYFTITLPLVEKAHQPDQALVSSPTKTRPISILLAEDNPTNAYIVTEYLTEAGHRVEHAQNGRDAVQLALKASFDLILMDISMPEMDGIQATRLIRSSPGLNRETPILALTAHAGQEDREKFLASRMNGHLTKPVRRADLLRLIEDLVSGRPAAATAKRSEASDLIVDMEVFGEFLSSRRRDRTLKTLGIYITELDVKLETLSRVLTDHDRKALEMLAHAAVGSASMVGASKLASTCRTIETECKEANNLDWDALRDLETLMQATRREFTRLRDDVASGRLAELTAGAAA